MARTVLTLLLLSVVFTPITAAANYQCTDPQGRVSFQQLPCEPETESEPMSQAQRSQGLQIPGQNWSLSYDAPRLTKIEEASRDGHYQYLASAPSGMVVSVFVEPSEGRGTDKRSCGDYYWRRTAENPAIIASTVERTDRDEFIIVSYAVEVPRGDNWIVQGNYNIYGYRNGQCVDIHLSRLFADDKDIDFSELIRFAGSLEYVVGEH